METLPRLQTNENPFLQTSQKCNRTSSNTTNGGVLTPKFITRSEITSNTCPTTFVQADTCSFKQVVQVLTGSSETISKQASKTSPIVPIKKPGFKLYERRNSLIKNFKISPLIPDMVQSCRFSPRQQELLSASMLDFPSLVPSPVTPLNSEPFIRSPLTPCTPSSNSSTIDQEKMKNSRGSEPQLLPLFPTTPTRIVGFSTWKSWSFLNVNKSNLLRTKLDL